MKVSLENLQTERRRLIERKAELEKAIDEEKKVHQKFVENVAVSQKIQDRIFEKERRLLSEKKKELMEQNRQLTKDLSFHKQAYEKLVNKEAPANIEASLPVSSATVWNPTSSKFVIKIDERLMEENEKLKLKVSSLSATIRVLQMENERLENWKSKMNEKEAKVSQQSEELTRHVDSTRKTNKETFTPAVLERLRQLCEK